MTMYALSRAIAAELGGRSSQSVDIYTDSEQELSKR